MSLYSYLLSPFSLWSARCQRDCFNIKHYAGKVKYTVKGWVERNMDRIPQSFNDTLQSSSHAVSVQCLAFGWGGR